MTTFFRKTHPCPVCGQSVEVTHLTSTNYMGQHTDFHRITVGFAPLPLLMSTCENCGFSAGQEEFEEPTLTDDLKQRILAEIQPIVKDQPLDGGRRYELFALIQELAGADAWMMGNHYLRAAWAAHDTGSPHESSYRRYALDFFQRALDANLVPAEQVPPITYLVGELYRRVGELDLAEVWFNRVIASAQTDEAWVQMAKFAERQRDTPQEQF